MPPTKYQAHEQSASVKVPVEDEIRDEYLAAMVWAKDSGALGRRPKRDSDPAMTYTALRKERADEEAHLKEWSYFIADPVKPVLKELAERKKTEARLTEQARPIVPRSCGDSSEPVVRM